MSDAGENVATHAWNPEDDFDDDGDGFIGCSPLTGRPSASVQGGGDCDDGALANWHNGTVDGPNIHPGATEVCDGLDNDCDEVVDEGCYGD